MKTIRATLLCCFFLFASLSQCAVAATLVSPVGFDSVPGPVNNAIPFSWSNPRYQQIHSAADLTLMVGEQITSIAFRVDEAGDSYAGGFTFDVMEVAISSTNIAVDELSTDLDANHGANLALARSGRYVVPPLEGDLLVNPFDLRFDLQVPFRYTGGNLLIDFFMSSVDTPLPWMDAVGVPESVDRAYIDPFGNPRADRAGRGLVTQFGYTPEPSSLLLATAGLLSLVHHRATRCPR